MASPPGSDPVGVLEHPPPPGGTQVYAEPSPPVAVNVDAPPTVGYAYPTNPFGSVIALMASAGLTVRVFESALCGSVPPVAAGVEAFALSTAATEKLEVLPAIALPPQEAVALEVPW